MLKSTIKSHLKLKRNRRAREKTRRNFKEKILLYGYKNNLSATYFEFRVINACKEILPKTNFGSIQSAT